MSPTVGPNPRPIFRPREVRSEGAIFWYVEAEWPDGTLDEIGQFGSIGDTWKWIAIEARAWFDARRRQDNGG